MVFAVVEDAQYRGQIVIVNKTVSNDAITNYEFFFGDPIPQDIINENFRQLKQCVLKNDLKCIGNYIMFSPDVKNGTRFYNGAIPKSIISFNDLSKKYDKIFTQNVKDAVKQQKEKDLSSSVEGVMIGNGQLWLNYFCEMEKPEKCYFKIYVINSDAKLLKKN